ncbi:adenosylcobinamide-GDP ribazoletransferase [Phytoactinopolyspora limicola]|uniref:adenosylcobinamide-GDP ribazoletransferase n=1 Tax=Phytoactinopolyspora limicola TaxID=2715536 RepID=UPI001A9C30B0|nr:adenosylcobinamide-GDP ribazoletransferase [Phytoactinopolyspora limicola]
MGDAWRLALGTLTTVRVPPPGKVTRVVAGRAMLLAPVAGCLLGLLGGAVLWLSATVGTGGWLAAALAVMALRLGDRAFHLDGLADTADGLAASYDRERALAVMRTGDTGPAGAVALVLVLLVQVAAAAQLAQAGPALAAVGFGVAITVSRAMLAVCCVRGVPSARPDGLGAAVAGSVGRLSAIGMCIVVTGALAAVLSVADRAHVVPWWAVPVAVVAAIVATGVVLRRCVRRFGGVTGDVLGAVVEVSLAASLTALVPMIIGS